MKIKEIIKEGKLSAFAKGFAQGLLPQQMRDMNFGGSKNLGPPKTDDELYGAMDWRDYVQEPAEPAPLPQNIDTAQNIPAGHRLAVTNPQGNATFYKYPNGQWTDEFGSVMPKGAYAALDKFADASGRMEKIPKTGKTGVAGFRTRGSR